MSFDVIFVLSEHVVDVFLGSVWVLKDLIEILSHSPGVLVEPFEVDSFDSENVLGLKLTENPPDE